MGLSAAMGRLRDTEPRAATAENTPRSELNCARALDRLDVPNGDRLHPGMLRNRRWLRGGGLALWKRCRVAYGNPMDAIGDDDLALHREISPKERVDAILNESLLSTDQAVAALDAQYRENQATFPHVVIVTVMVAKSTTDMDTKVQKLAYVGPFADRRTAEAWAASRLPESPRIEWDVARMDTPEIWERSAEETRKVLGE